VGHEFADGIVSPDEEIGEVSVQALHADARTANATARLGAVGSHGGATTACGVLLVRLS
jgi:hypothetical protein